MTMSLSGLFLRRRWKKVSTIPRMPVGILRGFVGRWSSGSIRSFTRNWHSDIDSFPRDCCSCCISLFTPQFCGRTRPRLFVAVMKRSRSYWMATSHRFSLFPLRITVLFQILIRPHGRFCFLQSLIPYFCLFKFFPYWTSWFETSVQVHFCLHEHIYVCNT